jgi:hypothetical protein
MFVTFYRRIVMTQSVTKVLFVSSALVSLMGLACMQREFNQESDAAASVGGAAMGTCQLFCDEETQPRFTEKSLKSQCVESSMRDLAMQKLGSFPRCLSHVNWIPNAPTGGSAEVPTGAGWPTRSKLVCNVEVPNGAWPDNSPRTDRFSVGNFGRTEGVTAEWKTFVNLSENGDLESLAAENVEAQRCPNCFNFVLRWDRADGKVWFRFSTSQDANGNVAMGAVETKEMLPGMATDWHSFSRGKSSCTLASTR